MCPEVLCHVSRPPRRSTCGRIPRRLSPKGLTSRKMEPRAQESCATAQRLPTLLLHASQAPNHCGRNSDRLRAAFMLIADIPPATTLRRPPRREVSSQVCALRTRTLRRPPRHNVSSQASSAGLAPRHDSPGSPRVHRHGSKSEQPLDRCVRTIAHLGPIARRRASGRGPATTRAPHCRKWIRRRTMAMRKNTCTPSHRQPTLQLRGTLGTPMQVTCATHALQLRTPSPGLGRPKHGFNLVSSQSRLEQNNMVSRLRCANLGSDAIAPLPASATARRPRFDGAMSSLATAAEGRWRACKGRRRRTIWDYPPLAHLL